MSVETAVIPVAGVGSRTLPFTSAIPKCFLPIYEKESATPVVDYMVEDCVGAGIERVIFVTSESGKVALQNYFEGIRSDFEGQLIGLYKQDIIDRERERRRSLGLNYEYIIQPLGHYGTAYPPYLARQHLKGEKKFVLMGGDDFVYNQDGSSELRRAISLWETAATDHVIMGNPVDRDEAPKYGILQTDEEGRLVDIDEKPPRDRVPDSPVANISRYGLSDVIWPFIDEEMDQSIHAGEEHFITNAINSAIWNHQTFQVHELQGKYMDGGTPKGLLEASNYIYDHPRTGR
jgi:UTP--glucose-1-phosphate uridylyltransferase